MAAERKHFQEPKTLILSRQKISKYLKHWKVTRGPPWRGKTIFGETLVYGFWPLLYFWPLLDLWALLYFWAFLLVWPRYILNSFGVWCFLYSFVLWPLLFYELFQKKCVRFLTFFIWSFFVPFYFCFHIHSVFMFCIFMIFSDIAMTPFSDPYF